MQRQTTMMNKGNVTRKWYVIDAKAKPIGRLASEIAQVLTGKNKPTYTPNVDCGGGNRFRNFLQCLRDGYRSLWRTFPATHRGRFPDCD